LVNRVLSWQLLIVVIASVAAVMFGWRVAGAVLLGGVIAAACNFFFARRVLAERDGQTAEGLLLTFYVAEFIKIAMAAVLLAAAYAAVAELNGFALIAGFLLTHVGGSVVLGTVSGPMTKVD